MSEKQNPAMPAQSGAPQEFYPPPPPGPPPNQQKPLHSNDIPLPDEKHPGWTPSRTDSELYDTDYPPTQGQQHAAAAGEPHKSTWGDKLSALGTKAAAPFNALANKMGSESFLPTTMDKESEKAARILRSFCKDGIYTEADQAVPLTTGEVAKPKGSKSLLTIPSKVISRAVGLAIFTTGRVGYGVSGSSGSGILVARLPDGRWSPPSGVQIHSLGTGFVIGLDIYDCVIVINTPEALKAFTSTRLSLGSDIAIAAGPYGAGGSLEVAGGAGKDKPKSRGTSPAPSPNLPPVDSKAETNPFNTTAAPGAATGTQPVADPAVAGKDPKQPGALRKAISAPVFSYVKSRGLYAGWQIDGTVVTERKDANAAFYGTRVSVEEILKGNVPAGGSWNIYASQLHAVIKGAEGWRGAEKPPGGPHGMSQQHMMSPAGGAPYYQPPPSTTGGPESYYQPPPSTMGGPEGYYQPSPAARDVKPDAPTAQMEQLNVAGNRLSGQVPVQAAVPQTKAEEAASEASGVHRSNTRATMLPAYSVQDPTENAGAAEPPAYVADGVARPAPDQKTG